MLYTELDTAHEFGIDDDVWFSKPRENRISMTAFIFAKRALAAMSNYDNHPPKKGKQ